MSKDKDPQDFLAPSHYFDYEHPRVRAFIEESLGDAVDPVERAVKLYYAVRDGIRYDPYRFYMRREYFTASRTLIEGAAYCVPKANLLTAVARGEIDLNPLAREIPANRGTNSKKKNRR